MAALEAAQAERAAHGGWGDMKQADAVWLMLRSAGKGVLDMCNNRGPAPPGQPTDVDAELMALCDQLLEVVARQEALYSVRRTIGNEDRTETQMAALFDERHDVAGRIMETPNARTNQGRDGLVRQCLAI